MSTTTSPSTVKERNTIQYQDKLNQLLMCLFLSNVRNGEFVTIVKRLLKYFRLFRFAETHPMFHLKRVLERCELNAAPSCDFSRRLLANILRTTVRLTLLCYLQLLSNDENTTKFRPFRAIADTFLTLFGLHELPSLLVRYDKQGDLTYRSFSLDLAAQFAYHAFTASISTFQFDADPQNRYPLGAASFAVKFQSLQLLKEASKFFYLNEDFYRDLLDHIEDSGVEMKLKDYAERFEREIDRHNLSRNLVYKEIAKAHRVKLLTPDYLSLKRRTRLPPKKKDIMPAFCDVARSVMVSCTRKHGVFYHRFADRGLSPSYHDALKEIKRLIIWRHLPRNAKEEIRTQLTAYWCFIRAFMLTFLFDTVQHRADQPITMPQIIDSFHDGQIPKRIDTDTIIQYLLPRVPPPKDASEEAQLETRAARDEAMTAKKFLYVLLSRRPGERDTILIDPDPAKVVLSPSYSTKEMAHWEKLKRHLDENLSPESFLSVRKWKAFLASEGNEAGEADVNPVDDDGDASSEEKEVEGSDFSDDDEAEDSDFFQEEKEKGGEGEAVTQFKVEEGKELGHDNQHEFVAPFFPSEKAQQAPTRAPISPHNNNNNNNNTAAAAPVGMPGTNACHVFDVFSLFGDGQPRIYVEDEYKGIQTTRLAETSQDRDITVPPMKSSGSMSSQVSETTTVLETDAVAEDRPAYSSPPQPSPERKVPMSTPQSTHSFPVSPSEIPASLKQPLQIKEFVPKAQQQQKQPTPPSSPPIMQALPAALAEESPTQPLFWPPRPTGFRDPHAVISCAESLMKDAAPLRQEYADDDGYQGPQQQQQPSFYSPMPQHAYPPPLPPPLPVQHHGDPSAGQRALYDPHLDEVLVQQFRQSYLHQQYRLQPQPLPRYSEVFNQASLPWAWQHNVRQNWFPQNAVHNQMDPNASRG